VIGSGSPTTRTDQSTAYAGYETLTSAQNCKLSDCPQSVYDKINNDNVYDEIRDAEIRDPEYLELVDDGPASSKAAVKNDYTTPPESVL